MSGEDLKQIVLEALSGIVPDADPAALAPDRSFRSQIEMDSLDYLNFVLALQKRLDLRISELDYPKLTSLERTVDYLQARLAAKGT